MKDIIVVFSIGLVGALFMMASSILRLVMFGHCKKASLFAIVGTISVLGFIAYYATASNAHQLHQWISAKQSMPGDATSLAALKSELSASLSAIGATNMAQAVWLWFLPMAATAFAVATMFCRKDCSMKK